MGWEWINGVSGGIIIPGWKDEKLALGWWMSRLPSLCSFALALLFICCVEHSCMNDA